LTSPLDIFYDICMAENTNPPQPTSTNSEKGNTNALLCYAVGWITGLIFLLTEKEDKFIRFHAAQSLVVFGALNLITFIPIIGWMLAPLLVPVSLILWILLMIKAYQGERFKLPVVGDYAEQVMEKIK
jgi:uncharacterized membrane protein